MDYPMWILLLLGLSCACYVDAFYGVRIPVVRSSSADSAVPNSDCIFVYSCWPSLSFDSTLPLPSPELRVNGSKAIFVGRAAGRCERRLHDLKCRIWDAVVQENQCRASAWPDLEESEASAVFLPSPSLEKCIVSHCQGHELVLQYFNTSTSSRESLQTLQAQWIRFLETTTDDIDPGCNLPLTTTDGMPDPASSQWITVANAALAGPFGGPADVVAPERTCSGKLQAMLLDVKLRSTADNMIALYR